VSAGERGAVCALAAGNSTASPIATKAIRDKLPGPINLFRNIAYCPLPFKSLIKREARLLSKLQARLTENFMAFQIQNFAERLTLTAFCGLGPENDLAPDQIKQEHQNHEWNYG